MNPYAKKLHTVIFDIETMGLMPNKDMIINAGFCDPKTNDVFQLFAEDTTDEKRLIEDIYQILSRYEAVVTYNGDRFDLPFVETRAKKYGIKNKSLIWSIDMYRYLKKYWPMAKSLPHLNQKSVEYVLGLSDERGDKIGGGECIPLYNEYLLTKNQKSKDLILLHNADDVRQLVKIYNAANFLPYDKIAFETGFGICSKDFVLCKAIRLDKNYLYIDAKKLPGGIPTSIFEDNIEIDYNCLSGGIRIKLFLQENGRLKFVDLTKLPCEQTVLKDLQGYHSGFLVISENGEPKYREINALADAILSNENLF